MKSLVSLYLPSYPKMLVYMLQSNEYEVKPYLEWLKRTKDFSAVMQRRQLDLTKAARLLLLVLRVGILIQVLLGLLLIYLGLNHHVGGGLYFGLALIICYPLLWAYLLVVPLILGRYFISGPNETKQVKQSVRTFAKHPGIKIAVAGSYGKTTMKELLKTVLSEGLKVAATPANKNVSISHARFAGKLEGNEDVLIIEYGEYGPGDIARFAGITKPTHGVITGLAPAHLDKYQTIQAAGEDIFSLADYLKGKNVYVNQESPAVKPFLKPDYNLFNENGALGWKVSDIHFKLEGTSFKLKKGSREISLKSGMLGRHQIGFVSFVAALALELGLTPEQVKTGVAKTSPFEHRMQPYQLNGAWIIDDTYNGNLEGIKAGTGLLRELKAKRKIYVTPGLVGQGDQTEKVHNQVGKLIAEANPDLVILMQNSVTDFIKQGLNEAGYKGEISVEPNPLEFYTNLNHFVASGDLVVMQNDWADNYA